MSSSWSELLTGIFIWFCISMSVRSLFVDMYFHSHLYICVAAVMAFVVVQGAANAIGPAKEEESTSWSSSWLFTSKADARICFPIFPSYPPPLATVAQSWWHAPGEKTCYIQSSQTISWVNLSSACSWMWQNVPKVGFICYWGGWVGHAVETFIEFDHFSQVCWPHNCAMAEMRDARYLWAALYIVSDFSNEKLSNDIWDIFSGPCREFADLSGIWICFPPKKFKHIFWPSVVYSCISGWRQTEITGTGRWQKTLVDQVTPLWKYSLLKIHCNASILSIFRHQHDLQATQVSFLHIDQLIPFFCTLLHFSGLRIVRQNSE